MSGGNELGVPKPSPTAVAADSSGELRESQDQICPETDLKANIHQRGAERKSNLFCTTLTNSNSIIRTTDTAISVIKI